MVQQKQRFLSRKREKSLDLRFYVCMGGFVCKKPMFQEKHPHPQQQWVGKVKFLKQKKKSNTHRIRKKSSIFLWSTSTMLQKYKYCKFSTKKGTNTVYKKSRYCKLKIITWRGILNPKISIFIYYSICK